MTKRSFTAGELSPSLAVRADLSKYHSGLSYCKNFIVKPQGGVFSRPGTRFIDEVGSTSTGIFGGRVIPFQFNTEQTYVLVFMYGKINIIKDGALIQSGGSPYEIATPYTYTDCRDLSYTQSADVMTICHPRHPPKNLSRNSDTDWTFESIDFGNSLSAPTGLNYVMVGSGPGDYDKIYKYVITAVNDEGVESPPSAPLSTNEPNGVKTMNVSYGVQLTWNAVTGADYYKIYKSESTFGGIYGLIAESKELAFRDFNIAPDMSETPPEENEPFSATGDYPSCVNYYQQRRVFAATDNNPQTLWTTQTGIYDSLRKSRPARADDSIELTIASQQVNRIRHVMALDNLLLLTAGGEWRVTEGQEEVLAPDTVGVRIQSYNGASTVRPVIVNDTILYIQEKGNKLRDMGYTFTSDKYQGNDLSIMAEHLFEGYIIIDMAYADEPDGVLWCVRSDGILLGLTYQKEHEVWAWHQHDVGGTVDSVCVITEDGRDALYMLVKRTIQGEQKIYVERLEARESTDVEDCFCVDSGLTYDGRSGYDLIPPTLTDTVSGLDHLEGEEVVVVADGNVIKGLTVSSGQVSIDDEAAVIHVGLAYTPELITLEIDSSERVVRGKKKSVSSLYLNVKDSRGGWVGPVGDAVNENLMKEIKPRFVSDNYDAISLKSFDQEITLMPDWNDGGKIRITQPEPLPLNILAITPEIDIGG